MANHLMVGEIVTEEQLQCLLHDHWFTRTPSGSNLSQTNRSKFGGILGDISSAFRSLISHPKHATPRKSDTVSPPWRQAYTPSTVRQQTSPNFSPRSSVDDQVLNRSGPWDTNILMLARRGFFYREKHPDVRVVIAVQGI
eukprot:747583-Hanusia_phi.AAC.3